MIKQMITFLALTRFSTVISQNITGMAGFFQRYFAGTENLRVVSIILLLLAFILFLFLIVILYIKSLLAFIKESETSSGSSFGSSASSHTGKDLELERELEKELERDLEKSKIEREETRRKQKEERNRLLQKQKEEEMLKKKKENIIPFSLAQTSTENSRGRATLSEFDWKTGRTGELDEQAAGVRLNKIQTSSRPLIDLTGLIINMLGRDIDAGKIAQTVKSKCQDSATEEEIIQTIDSIKSFISLSNALKFEHLPEKDTLPTPHDALLLLSQGDTGDCLSLLENLINHLVDKSLQSSMPQKRDIINLEASNYACLFGSLARLQGDTQLATSAFELAIELSPKNPNAWSSAGDAYAAAEIDSRAIEAYNNVLNYADPNLYPHQIANAHKKLGQYYERQGDPKNASRLYSLSDNYYNTIGINLNLTSREQDIIDIIESKQQADMPSTIDKLLNISYGKRQNYA